MSVQCKHRPAWYGEGSGSCRTRTHTQWTHMDSDKCGLCAHKTFCADGEVAAPTPPYCQLQVPVMQPVSHSCSHLQWWRSKGQSLILTRVTWRKKSALINHFCKKKKEKKTKQNKIVRPRHEFKSQSLDINALKLLQRGSLNIRTWCNVNVEISNCYFQQTWALNTL